jgi:hypothetical protein
MSQQRVTLGLPHLKNYPASDSLMSKIDTAALAVKPKEKYRLTNWSSYNAGLKQRGSLTLWLCEDLAQHGITKVSDKKEDSLFMLMRVF